MFFSLHCVAMARAPKTTTAPTGQIAPFGLRMLPELKEKIEQAARESGRSMNAEIVARLEESFSNATASANVKIAVDTHLVLLESQSAMNEMRIRMAKFQLDHLASRLHGLNSQPMKPVREMSNAELDAFEAGTTEIAELQAEISAVQDELRNLQIVQKAVLESIEDIRPAIKSKIKELETAISARPKKISPNHMK